MGALRSPGCLEPDETSKKRETLWVRLEMMRTYMPLPSVIIANGIASSETSSSRRAQKGEAATRLPLARYEGYYTFENGGGYIGGGGGNHPEASATVAQCTTDARYDSDTRSTFCLECFHFGMTWLLDPKFIFVLQSFSFHT